MKKILCCLLLILIALSTASAQSATPPPGSNAGRTIFEKSLQPHPAITDRVLSMVTGSSLASLDPLLEIIYYFNLVRGLIGDALGYWQDIKGVAGMILHPLSVLKTLAKDWLQNCTPLVPLPNFMDVFLDFVSGKTPFMCCDKSILDYFLNDLSGGQIHWLDENGNSMISPNNNFYALDRYEAAKALTSLGPDRNQLAAAFEKADNIQSRVLDNSNAAKTTLDGLAGILKVEGIRADMNGSDVMFAALDRMEKLRGQTFVEQSTSAAIEGVFGAGPLVTGTTGPAPGSTGSGYQNLFQ